MNWELWVQVLDTFAFMCVTPEIIGEGRLKAFREYLERPHKFLASIFTGILLTVVGEALVVIPLLIGVRFFHITMTFIYLICIPPVLLMIFNNYLVRRFVIPAIVFLVRSFAARGSLFLAGVTFFFVARAISVLLAIHPAAGGHGG